MQPHPLRLSYGLVVGVAYLLAALVAGLLALVLLVAGQHLAALATGLPTLYLVYASTLYHVRLSGPTLLVASLYHRPRRYAARDFARLEPSPDPLTPLRLRFAAGTSYRFKPVLQPTSWLDVEVLDWFIAYWTAEITRAAAGPAPVRPPAAPA